LDAAAWRLLDAWLEATGDYAGVRVLRYYAVYRAMVRAKIARLRARDADYRRYLAIADLLAVSARPAVVLMHGLAGSGKTTVAQALLERAGAIRVRSDVERKRLHGLAAGARTHAQPYGGIYAPEATRRTYDRLKEIVRDVVDSGRTAIVDAAFLWRAERDAFRALARELGAPFLIVSCRASRAELRRRVAAREAAMSDASEAGVAVLENQIATQEPLAPDASPGCSGLQRVRHTGPRSLSSASIHSTWSWMEASPEKVSVTQPPGASVGSKRMEAPVPIYQQRSARAAIDER